jgi:dihydrofolate reductase
MKLSLVAAVAKNGVIGSKNGLPWYIPEDLKHYKQVTMGHTMVMGRKTFESILKSLGKPLPGRKNVVITRTADYSVPEGVLVFPNIDSALEAVNDDGEVFINGGGEIYNQTIDKVEKLYLTEVHEDKDGDVFFPKYDKTKWREISREDREGFSWVEYERLEYAK